MPHNTWFNRLLGLSRHKEQPEVVGLVLSGGGSRASFHLGALRYLYDRVHIAPTCIVGTSAGSIVSCMLAQSSDAAQQARYLTELESTWLAMTGSEDMFVEQSWFTRLRGQWDGIAELLAQHADEDTGGRVVEMADDDDAEALVKRAMEEDPSLNVTMTPGIMWQLIGSLPRIGRAGAELAASMRGADRAASAYRPGPIVDRLLFESSFRPSNVADSGVRLRVAFVDLNSGQLRFMSEDGVIVDRDDKPIDDNHFDLTLGVWASCAIPGIFRPVKLGDGVYVDGGVRENLPVEMAVTNLGVTKPYVIAAAPPGVEPGDYTNRDVVTVLLRAAGLVLDETIQDEVEWAISAGACVIQPRMDIHSSLTVDPVLLRVNRDYGWTRAAEEVTGAPGSLCDIDDAIFKARCRWAAIVAAGADEPDERVDGIKKELSQLLAEADATLLPPGHQAWAQALV